MNMSRLLVVTAALTFAGAAVQAASRAEIRAGKNQAKLAKMLEGRAAGEPLTCIPGFAAKRLEIIEGVALVYTAGDTIYVSKPKQPGDLRRDDILVVERYSGQLCNTDVVRTVDRSGGYLTGILFLEKFVPYKKQD